MLSAGVNARARRDDGVTALDKQVQTGTTGPVGLKQDNRITGTQREPGLRLLILTLERKPESLPLNVAKPQDPGL
jgi:hypothetical protein